MSENKYWYAVTPQRTEECPYPQGELLCRSVEELHQKLKANPQAEVTLLEIKENALQEVKHE